MAKAKFNLDTVAMVLLVIGGLNWGLYIWNKDVVAMIANITAPIVGTIVYALVALSAILIAYKKWVK